MKETITITRTQLIEAMAGVCKDLADSDDGYTGAVLILFGAVITSRLTRRLFGEEEDE